MVYLVFGLHATDVDSVADQLAAVFSWSFEKRNSSYIGDYCLHRDGERRVQVKPSRDPKDDYFESEHPECGVLIYATLEPQEASQFRAQFTVRFPNAVLIRDGT